MKTPRSITIEYLGTLPKALAKNKGNKSHWRYRQGETKNLREVGWGLILKAYGGLLNGTEDAPLFLKATILVTQHWCGKPMDVSGVASASAPLIDSFMDAGVIEDDGPAVVVETRYAHVRVPHRPGAKIVVTCTEVPA